MASTTIPHSRSPRNDLTAAYVRSALDYDPATGIFTWRTRPREHFATKRVFSAWNARCAGNVAGSTDGGGYRAIEISGRDYRAHRLAWLHVTGEWPSEHIDHVNGAKNDNRLANLREASRCDNMHNSKRPRNNTSGFKGVSFYHQRGRWAAKINTDGTRRFLGLFATAEAAHAAYCKAAAELHGKFSRTI